VNVSKVSIEDTARTRLECAVQRAENLAVLGAKRVLELCVGPSLKALETAYGYYNIEVVGNDIDPKWRDHYPQGKWIIGDALEIPWTGFDTVVFAPPLSKGCDGTRESSLKIDEVTPSYRQFMQKHNECLRVMVLPARCLSTNEDRKQFYRLLNNLQEVDVVPLTAGARRIRKYVDVYYRG